MRILWTLLILGCLVSSCTSTRFVGHEATVTRNDTLTYSETQKRLRTLVARVYLTEGQEVSGNIDQVTRDTVYVSNKRTSNVLAIPTRTIHRIEHVDRVGGFVGGLFGGTAGGLLVGAGVGALISAARNEKTGIGVVIVAVLGAGVGALVGTVYGVIHGIVHVYQFQEESVLHTSVEQDDPGTP